MGLLSGLYGAVDRYLPADGLLDPMFGRQATPAQAGPQPHRFNPLRAVDSFLGLGVGSAIDSEHSRTAGLDLKDRAAQILGDKSLDKAARLQLMRAEVAKAAQTGADVSEWTKGLDAAESQMNLMGLFTPKPAADGATPGSPGLPTAPGLPGVSAAAPIIARELFRNPNAAKGVQALLKDSQPEIDYVNGLQFDKRNPSSAPRFVPDLGEGQRFVYDESGGIAGVVTADGYLQSIADIEGAKAGAQEAAKAGLDLVEVPLPNGQKITMPRSEAVRLLGGQGGGAAPPSAPPRVGAPALGVAQSPAEQAAAIETAKTGAERVAQQPKAYAGLQAQAQATDTVLANIEKALPMINRLTAGVLSGTSGIAGSPARDLKAIFDTILANIGFDKLQELRNNSPTGGALGQVSEQENRLLQAVRGSLDQGQSPEQLKANLLDIYGQLVAIKKQREQLYNQTYGAAPSRAGPTMQGKGYRILSVE